MLARGSSLGPYTIIARIGTGAMGEVYRAHDGRLDRDVAVKVIPSELAAAPDRIRRFEREAHAAGALNHPNVCAIHDVGVKDGAPFVVMELLEGESLRARLGQGPIPIETAIEWAAQAAQGLAAAHAKGIVHRDLKPDNLFLTRDGQIKVLDFSLAKLTRSDSIEALRDQTVSLSSGELGTILGTIGYMAPEQARSEPADHRADLFALGAILYEMLSGQRAFAGATAVETLYLICHEEPAPLSECGRDVPAWLEAVVRRCLEKSREARFQSARDVAFALRSGSTLPGNAPTARDSAVKSIVVLPLENLSPDPENAYLADGLTEEIISGLAKVRVLRVISRTSALRYRGTTKSLPAIARELGIQYALEGSVRCAGSSLRITVQLIDALADTHVWAETYPGAVDDVFDMQERVSRAVVDALKLQLTPQEHERLAERPIPNLFAYECYLKARAEILRFTEPSLDRALEHLEQGLRALPENPLLLAGVGYVHYQRANISVGAEDSVARSEAFATRALEIAPSLPLAHVVLGLLAAWRKGEIKSAITHLEHVLATDPNDPDALRWLGMIYAHTGRLDASAFVANRVIAIDPMSATSYVPLVHSHLLAGRFEPGLAIAERACAVDPDNRWTALVRFSILMLMEGHEDTTVLATRIEQDRPLTILHRLMLLWHYARVGNREKALPWLSPETLETSRRDYQYSWHVACGYALLGETDAALDWLGNAIERGFVNHRFLAEIDPMFAPLRGDPRFQALMRRARMAQAELGVIQDSPVR